MVTASMTLNVLWPGSKAVFSKSNISKTVLDRAIITIKH